MIKDIMFIPKINPADLSGWLSKSPVLCTSDNAFEYPTIITKLDKGEGDKIEKNEIIAYVRLCLLYTSPSPRDRTRSRMPSSA